jgi:hypothetical protein
MLQLGVVVPQLLFGAGDCGLQRHNRPRPSDGGTTGESGPPADIGVDMAPDLSELDAVFTVSDGPFVIRSTVDEHIAFPDIARLSTGEILLVYREASEHAVDPLGRLVEQIGTSDAAVWSDPETLYDAPDIDDRDPSITTLADGTVALNYFQYVVQTTADGPLTNYHTFYGESFDDGASFANVSIIAGMMDYPGAGVGPSGLWEDAEGQIISVQAVSNRVFESGGQVHAQLYGGPPWVPTNPDSPPSRVILASTADHGGNWTFTEVAPELHPDLWLQEPAILPLDDQRWLLHVRAADSDGPGTSSVMRQAISEDGGQTWSDYLDFDFIGQAPYLARLSSGVVLSAFRWRDDGLTTSAVNFMVSMDEGETWSELISVLPPQLEETGYPSILELDDGRVLFIYYVGGTRIEGLIYEVELVEGAPG